MKRSDKRNGATFSRALVIILLVNIVGAVAGCPARTPQPDDSTLPIEDRLQQKLDDIVGQNKTKFPGAVVYIAGPEFGVWSGAAGLARVETPEPAKPGDKFRAGSILKPFIATVILQLAEEGKLKLDDPMTSALPENITGKFSSPDQITIRMLLNHTSGIAECFSKKVDVMIAASPDKIWQVEEYLDLAAEQGQKYQPGEGEDYSNTNYILLGRVIERATGNTWREEVRGRIIEPLGLADTSLPEPGDRSIAGGYLHAYLKLKGKMTDVTAIDPSMADAAGGGALVTTAPDLAKFLRALMTGKLFKSRASLDNMLDFLTVAPGHGDPAGWVKGYGLGMTRMVFPGGTEAIGHGGETAGYSAFVFYLPEHDVVISGAVNTSDWRGANVELLASMIEIVNSSSKGSEHKGPLPK